MDNRELKTDNHCLNIHYSETAVVTVCGRNHKLILFIASYDYDFALLVIWLKCKDHKTHVQFVVSKFTKMI